MKLFVCVELLCVLLGISNGFPWYNNRGNGRLNALRQSQMYRNRNVDDFGNGGCAGWKLELEEGHQFTSQTRNGYLCLKSHGNVKILTWCNLDHGQIYDRRKLVLHTTLVDKRASLISDCEIYDIKIIGKSGKGDLCVFMLMDGLLFCVDEADLLPEYEILTIYPTVDYNRPTPKVNYLICNTSLGTYCPGPAKIASIVVDDEFQTLICPGYTGNGALC